MPERYHFDLERGRDVMRDEEGVEADSACQAIEQALAVIEEIRASGEIKAISRWELVIRDDRGDPVKRLVIW